MQTIHNSVNEDALLKLLQLKWIPGLSPLHAATPSAYVGLKFPQVLLEKHQYLVSIAAVFPYHSQRCITEYYGGQRYSVFGEQAHLAPYDPLALKVKESLFQFDVTAPLVLARDCRLAIR